jgi:VWFA-related protein
MAISLSWRRAGRILVLGLLSVQISLAAEPDKPAFTFHADADEVRLTFSAADQNDHGVATLRATDVVVIDRDIVVRQFQSFARSDWTRLQIAILADSSESAAPQFRQELASILEVISQTEGIPEENLSLFGFHDSKPSLICAGDCRTSHAVGRLPAARAGQLTPLFDSIIFATDSLAQHNGPQIKKVLIIFSDGIDTVSRNSLADAIEAALRAGVEIYALDLRASVTQGAAVLNRLTATTGGRYFPPQTGAIHVVNVILDGFHASYEITYKLPARYPGFHSIRLVPSHNLNLQFRSRSGYYYPNEIR